MVDLNKRRLAKKWRENDFEILKIYCNKLLEETGIKAKEEEIIPSPQSRSEVELVYWKKSLEQPDNEGKYHGEIRTMKAMRSQLQEYEIQ